MGTITRSNQFLGLSGLLSHSFGQMLGLLLSGSADSHFSKATRLRILLRMLLKHCSDARSHQRIGFTRRHHPQSQSTTRRCDGALISRRSSKPRAQHSKFPIMFIYHERSEGGERPAFDDYSHVVRGLTGDKVKPEFPITFSLTVRKCEAEWKIQIELDYDHKQVSAAAVENLTEHYARISPYPLIRLAKPTREWGIKGGLVYSPDRYILPKTGCSKNVVSSNLLFVYPRANYAPPIAS